MALDGRGDRVEQALAGRLAVLLPGGDERVPVRPQRRDGVALGGQAGGLEQVGAVADREAADVGGQADQPPVGGLAELPLPGQVLGAVVLDQRGQVGPVGGVGLELVEDALFEGHDVRDALAGGQGADDLRAVLVELGRLAQLDLDAGFLLVLLDQLVVAELAEGLHDQLVGLGAGGRALAAVVPARRDRAERGHRGQRRGRHAGTASDDAHPDPSQCVAHHTRERSHEIAGGFRGSQ